MRDIRVKRIAFAAICAAFAAVFLALTGVLPAARLAFFAAAGLFPFLADLVLGRRYSIPALLAGGILGWLFGAGNAGGLAYLILFGSYPIYRNFLVGKLSGKKALILALKLLWFNAAYGILLVTARSLFLSDSAGVFTPLNVFLFLVGGNAVFLLYDLLLGQATGWIFSRFDRWFRSLF